jgi:amino acid transporter
VKLMAGALIAGGFVGIAAYHHLTGPLVVLGWIAAGGVAALVVVFAVVAAYHLTAHRPAPGETYVDTDGGLVMVPDDRAADRAAFKASVERDIESL